MCELLCVGVCGFFGLAFFLALLEQRSKTVGYCRGGKQHDWGEWDNYLDGRSRECKRCGLNEHE